MNALQRASTVVIQKSLREGFGLTVAEALWKKKPVVASAVGGIPTQVIHKHTGLLAHSVEGTAYQIRFLLAHPDIALRLGEQGHEHVRENFLITGNLKRYLTLFLHERLLNLVIGSVIQKGVIRIDSYVTAGLLRIVFFSQFRIRFAWSVRLVQRLPGGGRVVLHVVPEKRNFPNLAFTPSTLAPLLPVR